MVTSAVFCNAQDSRDNRIPYNKLTPVFVPLKYTFPKKRYPRGELCPIKAPKNDFSANSKFNLKDYDKVLAKKRAEFYRRQRKNVKIDKRVARKMEKEYYFMMNYGMIPKRSEVKNNHL